MKKLGRIAFIILFVTISYIILAVAEAPMRTIVETVNATANWSGHADYAKAQAVLIGWQWWVWWIPGPLGIAAIAFVLKFGD